MRGPAGRLASLGSPSLATAYRANLDLGGVLAVAVSQSGATEEIVTTLDWARRHGARTVAITNEATSPLAELADTALVTQAGDELAVPATKTYTTQLAAIAVLALSLGPGPAPAWTRGSCGGSRSAVSGILESAPGAAEALASGWPSRDPGGVRPGFAYSTALEVALKLKETCYVTAVGLSYADLVHGPIAILDVRDAGPAGRRRRRPDAARDDRPRPPDRDHHRPRLRHRRRGRPSPPPAAHPPRPPASALPEYLAPFALVVPGQLLVEALARARAWTRTRLAGSRRSPRPTPDGRGQRGAARRSVESLM